MENAAKIPPWERRIVGRVVRGLFMGDRSGGPWLPPAHLRWEPVEFEGNTGATLKGRWFPAAAPRGTVVLVHPDKRYGKHWFEREGYVEFLHGHGYDVLTFDLAGYGESVGPSTYFPEDLVAAYAVARKWSGGFPVHVLGVSLGSFVAANASPYLDGVESMVLESPYPSFNAWYGRGSGRVAMAAFDLLFPRTAPYIRTDRNLPRALAKRVLVVSAKEDALTPAPLSAEVAKHGPAGRTTYVEYEGVGHLEIFGKAPAYRDAILATLAGKS